MRVLLLSYHFFNYSSEGMVTAKLARALADHGHEVTVFTSEHTWLTWENSPVDARVLAGVTVHTLGEGLDAAPRWWVRCAERAATSRLWATLNVLPSLFYGCLPFEQAWLRNVVNRVARDAGAGVRWDVMLSRLNPAISHLAALRVCAARPRLPWCAYFSDPWPYHLYPPPYRFRVGPVSRRRQEQLLQRILARAGSLVFPSRALQDHLLTGRRARHAAKAFVAPHLASFWGPAPAAASAAPTRPWLLLRHAGFLMKERRVEPLYDALRRLFAARPDLRGRLRIEFAGRFETGARDVLPEAPPDLRETVGYSRYMLPAQAWHWLLEADVFLLVEADLAVGVFMPSKLADYLSGGRPILALSPRTGTVADYLADGGGLLAPPGDAAAIAGALATLYDLWSQGTLQARRPSPALAARVSPDSVVPVYERAFATAGAGRGTPCAP